MLLLQQCHEMQIDEKHTRVGRNSVPSLSHLLRVGKDKDGIKAPAAGPMSVNTRGPGVSSMVDTM